MAKKSKGVREGNTEVISFRVSKDLHGRIEFYAKSQVDEAGLSLNAATAARRLMLKALSDFEKPRGK